MYGTLKQTGSIHGNHLIRKGKTKTQTKHRKYNWGYKTTGGKTEPTAQIPLAITSGTLSKDPRHITGHPHLSIYAHLTKSDICGILSFDIDEHYQDIQNMALYQISGSCIQISKSDIDNRVITEDVS